MNEDEQRRSRMASDDNNFPLSDAERSPEPAPESPSSRLESPITPGYPGPIDPHLPDDLRVPWNWLDLFFLVAVAVSGTIVITLLLIKGFAIFGLSFRQIQKSASDQNLFLIFNQTLLSALLLAYLAAQMRHSFHAPFWRTIGWRPLETGRTPRTAAHLGLILSGFMLAILVTASSAVFKAPKQTPIEQFFQDRRSALLLMTANKIGTYGIAVLAKENNVPFYVAAPISTIDLSLPTGDQIPIEERSPEEVTHAAGIRTAPDVRAAHIAFDVTPARYITAIITENGVAHAPFIDTLPIAVRGSHHS